MTVPSLSRKHAYTHTEQRILRLIALVNLIWDEKVKRDELNQWKCTQNEYYVRVCFAFKKSTERLISIFVMIAVWFDYIAHLFLCIFSCLHLIEPILVYFLLLLKFPYSDQSKFIQLLRNISILGTVSIDLLFLSHPRMFERKKRVTYDR